MSLTKVMRKSKYLKGSFAVRSGGLLGLLVQWVLAFDLGFVSLANAATPDVSANQADSEAGAQTDYAKKFEEDRLRELLSPDAPKEAHNAMPETLKGIAVQEHLGKFIDLSLKFQNESGALVELKDFFKSGRPVILSLNYYDCATLCTLQLTGIAEALQKIDWTPGKEFEIVTVSIDPQNSPELATDKRQAYLEYVAKPDANWHFLLDSNANVQRLAQQLGFEYTYDQETDQYAHAAVTYLLTPDGKISRYLYGISPRPRDLKFALMDASEGKLGSTVERFILNCFHYDALNGKYTPFAINTMRLGGVLTAVCIGFWLAVLWRREKRKTLGENFA